MMTLEDFFTLTEIKNGLTAPFRVEELINVMRKEKDCYVKNAGDATRHWAAVASTIAATENKDCLDLFIQLDGLSFIQRWLKDAQKFSNDTNDSLVEESIVVILQALKKLHITAEKSISSGILFTVKSLYESTDRVQSRFGKELSILLDRWMQEINDNKALHPDAENVGVHFDDDNSKLDCEEGRSSASGIPVSRTLANDENQTPEPVRDKTLSAGRSDAPHQDNIEDSKVQSQRNELEPHLISGNSVARDRSPDLSTNSAVSLMPVQEDKEETPLPSVGGTATAVACSFPVVREGSGEEQKDCSLKSNELTEFENHVHKIDGSSGRSCVTEKSDNSSQSPLQEPGTVLEDCDAVNVEESAKETAPAEQDDVCLDNAGVCQRSSNLDSERVSKLDSTGGMCDKRISYSIKQGFKSAGQDAERYRNALRDLSMNGSVTGKHEDYGASFSRMEDFGPVNGDRRRRKEDGDLLMTDSDFFKPKLSSKTSNIIDKRSDMELEYGIVDALEVARQVAQEVEREVVEYREPSCSSSSDKVSEGGIRQLGKLDTMIEKQDLPTELQSREVQSAKSHAESYSDGETCLTHPDNLDIQPENLNEMESSLVTEAARGAGTSSEKGFCEFDLNQEVFNDDTDQLATPVSLPVSIVSVSRPAIASGLPVTPLQFEGSLGWKGSAATSAFRPASPRKLPDSDRTLSSGGNSDSSKQRQDFLDIDLNVAETGDESRKQNPVLSFLPSGESLVESRQRRPGGLKLDLNCVGDDIDALQSDLRMEGLFNNQNSYSASPACSSSSMQPLVRNIDLNDRPYVQGDASDQGPGKFCQNVNTNGGPNSDASVISIMGTRVEVGRKDFPLQHGSLPNGRPFEPAMGATLARTGDILGMNSAMSYHQTPFIGYHGLTPGPTISFSTMYEPSGSIPYMVDSRGAAVVPQIMGPMSAVPPSSYSHPPFIMNMTDAQLTPNGVVHSRPKFDLNSGLSDSGGLKQFLFPGHIRSMEEQFRANVQPSSSGVGGKRKEPEGPDGGWEGYHHLLSYKHHQPPWKQ